MKGWTLPTGALPWKLKSAQTVIDMLERHARDGLPCPTNSQLLDAGATSPWNVVGDLARCGNIVVEMYGRQRFITILRGAFAGTRLGPPGVAEPTYPLYIRVDDKGRHTYRRRKKNALRVA